MGTLYSAYNLETHHHTYRLKDNAKNSLFPSVHRPHFGAPTISSSVGILSIYEVAWKSYNVFAKSAHSGHNCCHLSNTDILAIYS